MHDRRMAQFFTPPAVAQLTWELALALSGSERCGRVIDPAAGTGVFLDVALSRGWVGPDGAHGIELDPSLRPSGLASQSQFHTGDGLSGSFAGVDDGSFDLVIGNPPFGTASRVLPPCCLERLEKLGEDRFRIGQPRQGGGGRRSATPVARRQIEHLFVERALELARPHGTIAFILPQGFLANARYQRVRDWVLRCSDVVAVVALPGATFRRPGLNALTSVVVLRKRGDGPAAPGAGGGRPPRGRVLMAGQHAGSGVTSQGERPSSMQTVIATLAATLAARLGRGGSRRASGPELTVRARELPGRRWDVAYWQAVAANTFVSVSQFPEAELGDFISHLTYGPIVTGARPEHVPGGVPVIRQTDFRETGLHLGDVLRVTAGSVHDPARSRVRTGDLLLPRSGAGSLGRNRMAVYMHARRANVGCFVDLIRLTGINPYYVWLVLRSEPGWAQIRNLINGVGTPNINFSEIRSLRIPLIPLQEQANIEIRYRDEVWPHHRKGAGDTHMSKPAERSFHRLRADLEQYLAGSSSTLRA